MVLGTLGARQILREILQGWQTCPFQESLLLVSSSGLSGIRRIGGVCGFSPSPAAPTLRAAHRFDRDTPRMAKGRGT